MGQAKKESFEQWRKRFVVVSDINLTSFGWIQFRWSNEDEKGLCGIEITTGDVDGFDRPTDPGACDSLHEWLYAFVQKVVEDDSWPTPKTIMSIWESIEKRIRF